MLISLTPSITCVDILPISVTASPKFVTILLPADIASFAVSAKLCLVSNIDSLSLLIVSGSSSPKKDCSQANCADSKPNLIPSNANFKAVL